MSILIEGIDLPEAYTSAWLTVFECVGEHTFIKTHKVSAEQMQAIPLHGRLVDADALKSTFCAECNHTITCEDCDIDYHFGRLAPTIIEAEEGEPDD